MPLSLRQAYVKAKDDYSDSLWSELTQTKSFRCRECGVINIQFKGAGFDHKMSCSGKVWYYDGDDPKEVLKWLLIGKFSVRKGYGT